MKKYFLFIATFIVLMDIQAQSPWVLEKGKTDITVGYSRKTGGKRWYPTTIDTKETTTGADDTWSGNSLQEAPDLIDGKFHDFRYTYFAPAFGLGKGFEVSALFLYLDGWERITTDPKTGKKVAPHWEVNSGMTDFWLRLKYKLPTKIPMAIEVNSRFPDFYDQPGKQYSRYITQKIGKDTFVEASSEWRGIMKRDLMFAYSVGGSFDRKGNIYWQTQVGYNFRQGAYADQIVANFSAGYNIKINDNVKIVPNVFMDYIGGIGNGKIPDYTDRFYQSGRPNFYFNNSKTLRVYYSVYAKLNKNIGVSVGLGKWLWGQGAVKYTEPFGQVIYSF